MMPVFKNESNGTWYVMARYVDWKGERKQKCKRGFDTKRQAQEWERIFQLQNSADLDMTFEAFTELYAKDIKCRLKENTWLTKEHIINTKLLPYKVQERSKEIEVLEAKIATKQDEVKSLSARVDNFSEGLDELQKVEQALDTDEAFQLPDPQGLMSAKSYKTRIAEPLVKKLKSLIKRVLARCFEAMDSYYRLNVTNGNLYRENQKLSKINNRLKGENDNLRSENRDYKLLRKVFGSNQIDSLLEQAKQTKQRDKRFSNIQNER